MQRIWEVRRALGFQRTVRSRQERTTRGYVEDSSWEDPRNSIGRSNCHCRIIAEARFGPAVWVVTEKV